MKAWKRRNKQRSKVNPRRDIHLFTGDNCPLRPLKILENIIFISALRKQERIYSGRIESTESG